MELEKIVNPQGSNKAGARPSGRQIRGPPRRSGKDAEEACRRLLRCLNCKRLSA